MHATTWMNLETTMLTERRQIFKKSIYCVIPFVDNTHRSMKKAWEPRRLRLQIEGPRKLGVMDAFIILRW